MGDAGGGRVMGDARVRVPLLGEWEGAPWEAPELRVAEETPGFRPWRRARCSARTPPWLTETRRSVLGRECIGHYERSR